MKKITLIGVLGMLCLHSIGQSPVIKPLTIGDTVPDIVFNHVINYKTSTAKLSDFKDKLVILDFMSTGCLSCIEKLPRFDSIKAIYKDQLAILIVSDESQKRAKTFFDKNPIGKVTKLPMASEDSVLSKLFPHAYISHEVWIKDGIVKAITGPEYVVNKNIQTVLNDTPVNWPVKRDIVDFDYNKPLFHFNEETIPELSHASTALYSVFTNNIPDIPHRSTKSIDTTLGISRLSLINLPILDLYRNCSGQFSLPVSNITLKVKDTSRYIYNPSISYRADWEDKNTYCFETVWTIGMSKTDTQKKNLRDLDYNLGLESSWDKGLTTCLVLAKKGKEKNKPSLENVFNIQFSRQKMPLNITPSFIIYVLNQNILGMPVLDETGLDPKRVLDKTILNFSNLSQLNEQLGKYELELVQKERIHEMLVIKEKH